MTYKDLCSIQQVNLSPIAPIRNEDDYRKMVMAANLLADELDGDDSSPIAILFEVVTDCIEAWEEEHVKL